jgi:hypothetical protein
MTDPAARFPDSPWVYAAGLMIELDPNNGTVRWHFDDASVNHYPTRGELLNVLNMLTWVLQEERHA